MRQLTIHNINGTAEALSAHKLTNIDENGSHTGSSSVFAHFMEGEELTLSKTSDDKIVIGYLSNGLPFMLIIDGFFCSDSECLFAAIDQYITPLMSTYAGLLEAENNPVDCMTQLIAEIYRLRADYFEDHEFTMSLAIGYRKQNQLRLAGFGIGDTGIILKRQSGELITLAYNNVVNKSKDAFDNTTDKIDLELVIARNSVFDTKVSEGDELLGYTYLFSELTYEASSDMFSGVNVSRKTIAQHAFDTRSSGTLLAAISQANQDVFAQRKRQAISGKESRKFGDDCSFGSVKIPTATVQQKITLRLAKGKVLIPSINPSVLWKVFGYFLMAAGATLAIVGTLAFATSLTSIIFSAGTVPSAFMIGGGAALFVMGSGLVKHNSMGGIQPQKQ